MDPITERIDRLIYSTILATGQRPVGLIVGKAQMDELIASVYPNGRTATQALQGNPTQYAGLGLSEQVGVDGIIVITEASPAKAIKLTDDTTAYIRALRYVGAYPIIF